MLEFSQAAHGLHPWEQALYLVTTFLKTATCIYFRKIVILKPLTYFIVIPAEIQLSIKPLIFEKEVFEKEVTAQWTRCTVLLWEVILHQLKCFPSICVFFSLIQITESQLPPCFPSHLKFSPDPDCSKLCPSLLLCPILSLTYQQCYQILRRWSSFTLDINNTETNMMDEPQVHRNRISDMMGCAQKGTEYHSKLIEVVTMNTELYSWNNLT